MTKYKGSILRRPEPVPESGGQNRATQKRGNRINEERSGTGSTWDHEHKESWKTGKRKEGLRVTGSRRHVGGVNKDTTLDNISDATTTKAERGKNL